MHSYMGETVWLVDCTFATDGVEQSLRRAIDRIKREAEDGLRREAEPPPPVDRQAKHV